MRCLNRKRQPLSMRPENHPYEDLRHRLSARSANRRRLPDQVPRSKMGYRRRVSCHLRSLRHLEQAQPLMELTTTPTRTRQKAWRETKGRPRTDVWVLCRILGRSMGNQV